MTGLDLVHAVRSDSFAGVERYIVETCNELNSRGWRIAVLGGDPARMRSALSAEIGHVPARTTREVFSELKGLQAPLVHSHMTAADLASAVTIRPGVARVSTRHFAAARGSRPLTRLAVALAARRFSLRLAISAYVAANGGDGREVVLLNGVPEGTPPLEWAERDAVVLVAQRLEPEKDTVTVLHAWAECDASRRGWRLVIAGRGSDAAGLHSLAAELGIEDSVRFVGFRDDVSSLMTTARLFVAPAPREPFGLAVVEAMAAGMCVIAARGGAHLETLADAAAWFKPGDAEGCAALLGWLTSDQAAAAALGQDARREFAARLTIGRHVDALEQLYASVARL